MAAHHESHERGMNRVQASPSDQVKRSSRRIDVVIRSRLRYGDFRLTEVELANLSFGGFCATCGIALRPGEWVSIDLPDIGLIRARIAWCEGGRIGGAFVSPVDIRRSSAVAAS